jgi:carbamoyl-phosphate synthase small subunit
MIAKLILKDGTQYQGLSFGSKKPVSGELVFATGMVGYPESLTDPSYAGQILVLTYPLQGNYGVPEKKYWESGKIQVAGLIVSDYINTPSHHTSKMTLSQWLRKEGIPALEIKDTRLLAKIIRQEGAMLAKITPTLSPPYQGGDEEGVVEFTDPNKRNLVAEVSTKRVKKAGKGKKHLVLYDLGAKRNIARELVQRNFKVTTVPWNHDIFTNQTKYNGIVISNGPGNPKMAHDTIQIIRRALAKKIPIVGICLGNQILTLAARGDTYKLKFGHRGQNQPVNLAGTDQSYLTTQNHGFAVKRVPKNFRTWFINANDGTNEGIIHKKLPVMSVQFHPEATPGPTDTAWIFDYFLKYIR